MDEQTVIMGQQKVVESRPFSGGWRPVPEELIRPSGHACPFCADLLPECFALINGCPSCGAVCDTSGEGLALKLLGILDSSEEIQLVLGERTAFAAQPETGCFWARVPEPPVPGVPGRRVCLEIHEGSTTTVEVPVLLSRGSGLPAPLPGDLPALYRAGEAELASCRHCRHAVGVLEASRIGSLRTCCAWPARGGELQSRFYEQLIQQAADDGTEGAYTAFYTRLLDAWAESLLPITEDSPLHEGYAGDFVNGFVGPICPYFKLNPRQGEFLIGTRQDSGHRVPVTFGLGNFVRRRQPRPQAPGSV